MLKLVEIRFIDDSETLVPCIVDQLVFKLVEARFIDDSETLSLKESGFGWSKCGWTWQRARGSDDRWASQRGEQ